MSITIKELVDVVSEAGETTKVNAEKQIVALFEKVGAALKALNSLIPIELPSGLVNRSTVN